MLRNKIAVQAVRFLVLAFKKFLRLSVNESPLIIPLHKLLSCFIYESFIIRKTKIKIITLALSYNLNLIKAIGGG